ncbi:transcriptional regulator [Variovorax sp. J22P168]|uniref:phage regulatory CII family protein n=1 Tax=Variovorax jilinensis TaxID=3053513 RepID=UPI0025762842|nr:phage regulatory CII family protein [Variovorax sp. J22P168]MDM0011972.1 transcriptional regulator [Variovorax sp. J22P168]
MSPLDAMRLMIDNYPGGRAAVAVRIGKSEEVLRKETSGHGAFKHGLADAVTISDMCIEAQSPHCYAFVNEVAGRAGRLVELPAHEGANKQDIRADVAGLLKECSDTVAVVTEALADETISDNELRHVEREIEELVERAQAVCAGARARHAASRPAMDHNGFARPLRVS